MRSYVALAPSASPASQYALASVSRFLRRRVALGGALEHLEGARGGELPRVGGGDGGLRAYAGQDVAAQQERAHAHETEERERGEGGAAGSRRGGVNDGPPLERRLPLVKRAQDLGGLGLVARAEFGAPGVGQVLADFQLANRAKERVALLLQILRDGVAEVGQGVSPPRPEEGHRHVAEQKERN